MVEITTDSATFKYFPMSPTSNHLYMVIRGRLVKSSEGRLYLQKVGQWYSKNKSAVDKLKAILRDRTLRVDCAFYFPRSKLLTKKNTLKKLDATNRFKALHDALSQVIGVDDSHFISGYFEKRISENDESYVEITISEAKL